MFASRNDSLLGRAGSTRATFAFESIRTMACQIALTRLTKATRLDLHARQMRHTFE